MERADFTSMLTEMLRTEIRAHGPMLFHDFMSHALYHPEYGYYSSGRARVGREGDFFTSVSVGPLFGKLLARQFAELWEMLGRPAPFDLIEQGAHDGTLAIDVLNAMPAECPVRFTIVEPSPFWRARQEEKLSGRDVRWVEDIEALPEFTGVHFSNELIDAFPVHLLHRSGGEWTERAVDWDGAHFGFVDVPLSSATLRAHLPDVQDGYLTEVNLLARDWIAALDSKLIRGLIFVIDYGYPRAEYYAPHRVTGTLEAIAAHRRVDPLATPGEADLTAHVDFTSLAEASSLDLVGFTDQHHFLTGLSRLHFADGVPPDPKEMRAFQTLAHPTMLGRSFKALALGRGVGTQLSAFSFARDPRRELGLEG